MSYLIDRYAYDERGNLLQHTRPDGHSVHHAYDDLDQRFKTRDAEGGLWKYDYDQRGNVIETLDPLENKTQYTYDSDNLLVAITDANGGEKKLSYTPDGQLASYTDCSGKTTQWKYDTFGQLTKLIDAAGEETEYHYEAGHLSSLVHPDKTRDRFKYDAEGRLLSYVDALHRRTTWTYNEAGLIQQRLNPDDSTLHYHWDKLGQLVRLRNENNSEASFKYDPVGRLVMETGFDKQITDYFYDNSSELPTRRLDGDRITHFEYDPMGRLVESNAGERGGKVWETETFAYDGNGRLLLAENQACKLQWFYDAAGNNTREHQHFKYMQQPKVAVFTHEYDALNLRIATTRPDGHRVSWLTYGSGHLLGLKFDDRELLHYQRDDLHREIGREQGNGLVQRQTWTPNGQLLEQILARQGATKRIAARSYRYDEAGQLTHTNDLNRGDLRYRYDPVGRLLEARLNYDKELFSYRASPQSASYSAHQGATKRTLWLATGHERPILRDEAVIRHRPACRFADRRNLPMSHPADVPSAPDLQRFLDEEGTSEALAHLLEKALAARRNRLVDAYRGNAYTVSFEDEDVIIEWYGNRKLPAQHLPLDRFIALLRAWPEAIAVGASQ